MFFRPQTHKNPSLWAIISLVLFASVYHIGPLSAQKPTKIKIVDADQLKFDKRLGENIQRLIGNVILQQDSTFLYCDSAHVNEVTNSFIGFGNVHIKASDTLNIYSELLNYKGNIKVAELEKNVRLVDNDAVLTTDYLWYDRKSKIAYYLTGGKIEDSTNTLTSTRGYYYTDQQEAYFKDSVILVNPDYMMITDTMLYDTENEISTFLGPTRIISDDNLIYCERGWYDTKNNRSHFRKNAYFQTKEQKMEADSLFYDRSIDFGRAYNNITLTDTIQDMIINGNYGEFRRSSGYSYVTDSATAVMIDASDSLFLHADTLYIKFDSLQEVETLFAYYGAKFFRKDLQGKCDSLVYGIADSTIFLYTDPVLWSDENQLTADSVRIAFANSQVDSLALLGSAFIIAMDDTISRNTFNQIKGKTMVGYFKDNEMVKVMIFGNAESVFYVREDDGALMGINKTFSSDMNIYLKDNDIQGITSITDVDAHMYPVSEFPEEEKRLKNFRWIEGERPLNKEDIYK
jgi:lipopolysaccharide export system protein LptA